MRFAVSEMGAEAWAPPPGCFAVAVWGRWHPACPQSEPPPAQHFPEASLIALPIALSAIICAHNPRGAALERTLKSLEAQTFPAHRWELILVDNRSEPPLAPRIALGGLRNARIIREETLGLTAARLGGLHAAKAPLLAFIDDDNVLDPDYLQHAVAAFDADPKLGAAGGRNIAEYETPPPPWLRETGIRLACRDLGDAPLENSWDGVPLDQRRYDPSNPVGAGMIIRRKPMEEYARQLATDPRRQALDRMGTSLVSGGDNDIVMTTLEQGWRTAYLPHLRLTHLIPAGRIAPDYLQRLTRDSSRSWVLVLDIHGIRPWKALPRWAVPALRWKYYFKFKPWKGPLHRIQYHDAVGRAEGRSLLR